jgi:molecular chaperone HtpG
MELNPGHPILARLNERFAQDPEDALLDDYAHLLLGYGLIAEGGELPDPARFTRAVGDLMARGV